MRPWIDLLENLVIPSFVERITDDLLDEIIATGKWVEHGGYLRDQWEGGVFDGAIGDTHPELQDRPFAEVRHTPEFRDTLRHVLLHAAKTQHDILIHGSAHDQVGPLSPESFIYRGITGELSPERAGVYWSQVKSQSLGRFIGEAHGGTFLVAKIKDVTIDWEQTIRSRLDLANGGDELEIQLAAGSPVKAMAYRVTFARGRPSLTPIGPVSRKV